MFHWLVVLAGYLGPVFIVASPVLSYSDQAYSMHKRKSSAGFSLDIPLIMLVASMFKCVLLLLLLLEPKGFLRPWSVENGGSGRRRRRQIADAEGSTQDILLAGRTL